MLCNRNLWASKNLLSSIANIAKFPAPCGFVVKSKSRALPPQNERIRKASEVRSTWRLPPKPPPNPTRTRPAQWHDAQRKKARYGDIAGSSCLVAWGGIEPPTREFLSGTHASITWAVRLTRAGSIKPCVYYDSNFRILICVGRAHKA